MKLLVFGATSLVGSHFVEALLGKGVVAAGRHDPMDSGIRVDEFRAADAGDEEGVRGLVRESVWDAIVNFAARTDVDGCEKERPTDPLDLKKDEEGESAWRVNAQFPGWLAEEAGKRGVFLVHISTDFIFDGDRGPYPEDERPDPFSPKVSWYGYTKGVGEQKVISVAREHSAVVRISYPYRASFGLKADFARNLLLRAKAGTLYPLYTDQTFTPTWIPDVTLAVKALLERRTTGVFHVASPLLTTPYAFAQILLSEFGLDNRIIKSAMLEGQVTPGRAPRPLRGGLLVERIRPLGVDPLSYLDGARQLAEELTDRSVIRE